jgi:hypothetical protein
MVRSSGGSGTPAIGGAIAGLNREARDLEWRRAVVDVDDEDAGGLAAFDADLQRHLWSLALHTVDADRAGVVYELPIALTLLSVVIRRKPT